MSSLSHVSIADPNSQSSSLISSSFNNPSANTMDHSPLPSPNSSCFHSSMLSELDNHLSPGKFQQELAQGWQTPASQPVKLPSNSFGFADGRFLSAFSMEGLGNSQGFTDASEVTGSGSWEGLASQKLAYAASLGAMLPALNNSAQGSRMNLGGHGLPEGASVREFMSSLGSNAGCSGGVPSLVSSSPPLSEIEKLLNLGNSNWSSVNSAGSMGLTVDPSKGGLALQGVNLTASHCLANFSTDPGFAERAAKFSCFSNQSYSELAQSYSMADEGKTFGRSAPRASDKAAPAKFTRVNSGHLTPKCSAPNSPVGAARSGGCPEPNVLSENFCVKATSEASVPLEEPKGLDRRSGRPSSPSRIDGSDGTQMYCTSMNSDEADGSLGQEASSSCERGGCEPASQGLANNSRKKRRMVSKDRSKEAAGVANPMEMKDLEMDEGKRKRQKSLDSAKEEHKSKVEQSNSGNSDDSTPKSVKESSKPPEAPKPDYIHVRARRGQATDSHSLAERVRREKISERMKFLQDLVPGCSKVTGKAVMLDEIINYVQSLQRQVEFLSMKLAAVNPRLEFNIDSLFGKEMVQPRVAPPPTLLFAPDNSNTYPSLHQQSKGPLQVGGSCPPLDVHCLGSDPQLRRSVTTPLASMEAYADSVSQQISQAWDDELQSVVQMGFAQGRQTPLASPGLQGPMFPGQMKVEL